MCSLKSLWQLGHVVISIILAYHNSDNDMLISATTQDVTTMMVIIFVPSHNPPIDMLIMVMMQNIKTIAANIISLPADIGNTEKRL